MDSNQHNVYQETLDWLYSQLPMFSRVGAPAYKPGLDTTLNLDKIFNHPHKRFKSIHVGGTNGKGSTSHSIAAALQANGYKVGLYTSPHLVDFRERMRVNGEMIPRGAVVEFVKKWRETDTDIRPSFFELTMMMAFCWFAQEAVDYAVIEVGMGGRLDSTNIITPLLSVVTNISKDHTQFLGDTLEKIATEKAGIIKAGIPVVIGETTPETYKIFRDKAAATGTPIVFAEECGSLTGAQVNREGFIEGSSPLLGDFTFPLGGRYQLKNLKTVLTVIDTLTANNIISLDKEKTRQGLENVISLTGLMGRWQIIRKDPVVICDTGHNYAGLSETISQLNQIKHGKLRMVLGFVNDKDVESIVTLFPNDAEYYFTRASIPRAMSAEKVQEIFSRHGVSGRVLSKVGEAFDAALEASDANDVIYVGGSTFIVADFLSQRISQQGLNEN